MRSPRQTRVVGRTRVAGWLDDDRDPDDGSANCLSRVESHASLIVECQSALNWEQRLERVGDGDDRRTVGWRRVKECAVHRAR